MIDSTPHTTAEQQGLMMNYALQLSVPEMAQQGNEEIYSVCKEEKVEAQPLII